MTVRVVFTVAVAGTMRVTVAVTVLVMMPIRSITPRITGMQAPHLVQVRLRLRERVRVRAMHPSVVHRLVCCRASCGPRPRSKVRLTGMELVVLKAKPAL